MKLSSLIVSTCAAAAILAAQTPPAAPAATPVPAAPITPDTVIVTVEGKSYTAKQIDEMMKALPPQAKTMIDRNPQAGLTQLFILDSLSALAKQKKLDQVSPNKEALESKQRQYLANVVVQDENTHIHVTEAEQQAYYDAHKDLFQSVKISALYIAYTPHPKAGPDGKMPQTEAEAKAKADDLVKQLRAGADFAKLAAEHSEDKESAKKGGEYATIRRSDNYPAAIKDAIFKLKGDEVSDPVKQPAGFYIFKVTERNQQEFKDVAKTVFERVRQEKFSDWLKGMQRELAPKIDTP
jgi:peptidyl-prolyl cis-trans isomerase C